MSTKTYFDEAKKAQENLNPLLNQAIQKARQKLEKAQQAADNPRQDDLIEAIEKAPMLDPGEARQVLSDLQADAPINSRKDGQHLIGRIRALLRENEFDYAEAGKAAKAVVMALQGKIEAGLVKWPNVGHWSKALDRNLIELYAYWMNPERYEKIQQARQQAQQQRAEAEQELEGLQLAADSLKNIVPEEVKS